MSFLVLPQHQQFYSEGLSVFVPCRYLRIRLDKVSTKIQGLSSTDCNFQGFSRPWIYILKFKDFGQGACEHWSPRHSLKKKWVNPLSSKNRAQAGTKGINHAPEQGSQKCNTKGITMYQNDFPDRLLMHDLVYSKLILLVFFYFHIYKVIFMQVQLYQPEYTINWRDTTHFDTTPTGCRNISRCQQQSFSQFQCVCRGSILSLV